MRILFAVAAWGLGHSTRSLVLLRGLLSAGHEVTVLSGGQALLLLRRELGDGCSFVDVPDAPANLSRWPPLFYAKATLAMPLVFWNFSREQAAVRGLHRRRKFDRVVSDSRYGVLMRDVPSYYLAHSLRQIIPGRPYYLEKAVEQVRKWLLRAARKILVPDDGGWGLAGSLCHGLDCFRRDQLEYIGILSGLRKRDIEPDIDYFISVSGAEPQRNIFERMVLEQARFLSGRVVIALGKPDTPLAVTDDGHVAIHSYISRRRQEEMMNRARLVISRSGYTTLMELAELGKKALLVPTAGQSEQEYLSALHERLGTAHGVVQQRLNLADDVELAAGYLGIKSSHTSDETVERFLQLVAA